MCGIAGMYGISDKLLLKQMCDVIEHRRPDDFGYYVDDVVSIGMRRLSIIYLCCGNVYAMLRGMISTLIKELIVGGLSDENI